MAKATEKTPLVTEGGRYRVVLIPVDHSEHARRALDWYLKNINYPDDELKVIHCYEIHPPALPHKMMTSEWGEFIAKEEKKLNDLKEKYESLLSQLKQDNRIVTYSFIVERGNPGHKICDFAKHHNVTMIVMGSRGMGLVKRTILGSVSDYVMKHAHIPVVIVPKESQF